MRYSAFIVLLFLVHCLAAQAREATLTLEVANEWRDGMQVEAPIVLQLRELNVDFVVRGAVVLANGKAIPCQLDDMDGDRKPDELAFQSSFAPNTKQTFEVRLSDKPSTAVYPARTHAQMYAYDKTGAHDLMTSVTTSGTSDIYSALLHHGPAFESELVAYRIYFNEWQTVDCYGKQYPRLELQDTRFYPSKEQLAAGYGDDVLRVGQTVSVGTLKGWNEEQQAVLPFAPVAYRTESIVASGPVRSIVEIKNEDWLYQDTLYTLTTQYILYAGHRDVEVRVRFAGVSPQTLCTGVLRKAGDTFYSDHAGTMAVWSIDFPQNDTVAYARDTVGLAVCIPTQYVAKETSNEQNYLYLINSTGTDHFTYHFMFTSKRESVRRTDSLPLAVAADFFADVRAWREQLNHPLTLKIRT